MTTLEAPARRGGAGSLLWCGVLGALALTLVATVPFSIRPDLPPTRAGLFFLDYARFAVPGLALLAWRLWPRRAGLGLLLVAGVSGATVAVFAVVPDAYQEWMFEALVVAASAAPACAIVGVLAVAASLLHRRAAEPEFGRRGLAGVEVAAVALVGAALVGERLGPLLVRSAFGITGSSALAVPSLVLFIAVAVLSGVALALGGLPDVAAPSWRMTAAGALAATAPLVYGTGLYVPTRALVGDAGAEVHHLVLAAVFLGVAALAGVLAGARAGLAGLAAGLLLGAFTALIGPSVEVLRDMVVVALAATVVSILAGCAAAASRWRLEIGVIGTGIVVTGLVLIFGLFAGGLPLHSYDWITRAMTPVLLAIGVASAVALVSAIAGSGLGSSVPPVLAGLAVPVGAAVPHLAQVGRLVTPDGKAPLVGVLPVAIVALVVAGAVAAVVARPRVS